MSGLAEGVESHRYAGWEIRPGEHMLLVDGKPCKVGNRAFRLLLELVRRQGRAATKDELMAAVWPGLVVEDNNLSVQITALRKLLGREVIGNISGYGYRLAAQPLPAPPEPPLRRAAPPATAPRLFGRDAELDALHTLVGSAPLVSLVGTGGVGKTTLARALLAAHEPAWRDGVHWLDLTTLRPGMALAPLVAKALGVVALDADRERNEDLVRSLAQMQALMVLDNCEHMLEEVAAVIEPLRQGAAGIRWLVTSREPLHLYGESVYRIRPLQVPEPGSPPETAARSGAVALFCERARANDAHFALTDGEADLAADICRRLDGLPLAIEMAAARVATLGLAGVHAQIGRPAGLRNNLRYAHQRHQTLLETYEWSYNLLRPVEQRLFAVLAPFVGGFTKPMAALLCAGLDGLPGDDWGFFDVLGTLVDKSLVHASSPAGAARGERLHLLESARTYAQTQLEAAGQTEAVQRRHAEVVAGWFRHALHEFETGRDADWAVRYPPERRNVCAALQWACGAGDSDLLASLVTALACLDAFAHHTDCEVLRYEVPPGALEAASPQLRAPALLELGWAHYLDGNLELGTALCARALAGYEALDDAAGRYRALLRLIRCHDSRPGQREQALQLWARLQAIDESAVPLRLRLRCHSTVALALGGGRSVERLTELQRVAQHAGFDAEAAVCHMNITDELLLRHRYEEAADTAGLILLAGERHLRVRAVIHHNRAHALVHLGRIAEAQVEEQAMLRVVPGYAYLVLDLFAYVAMRQGRLVDAALMAGRGAEIKRRRALLDEASEAPMITQTRQHLLAHLGNSRTAALLSQGAGMTTDAGLALAWAPVAGDEVPDPARKPS